MARSKKAKNLKDRSWRSLVSQGRRRPGSAVAWQRAFFASCKLLLGLAALGGAGYGVWLLSEHLAENEGPVDFTGPAAPIRQVHFKSDGPLDLPWALERLALGEDVTLMDLDVERARRDFENEPQVASAVVRRVFPDVLSVEVVERKPVLRLALKSKGASVPELWLVSMKGVLYQGFGYSRASLAQLPFLDVDPSFLKRDETGGYQPIESVSRVSPLLELVRQEAPEVYRDWKIVSFLRPEADPELDPGSHVLVRSGKVKKIRFSPRNYGDQLRRLRYLLDEPGFREASSVESIDLSHGRSVFARVGPT